ncbi:SRPBCC family protein [Pseudoruegeria sp. SK021]|uniref:SRPBCC family protein n=1 Tax=Pseudoruegeria sp. SK021 TaxID=1933035 RepID=UPI000A229BD0|nr:SRPBCC family protein [Pseudoruegeria sp. SK021]OSP56753.1 hypothetical protein BV911_02050 [Pseudoruegeria sp. SK021]
MKLTVSEEVAASRQDVFQQVTDFDRLLGRPADAKTQITRLDHPAPVSEGSRWQGHFVLRGLRRDGTAELVSLQAPDGYEIHGEADGMRGQLTVALSGPPEGPTRLDVTVQLRPTSLTGRMIVQSLSLVRQTVAARCRDRLQHFAREIESRRTGPAVTARPSGEASGVTTGISGVGAQNRQG